LHLLDEKSDPKQPKVRSASMRKLGKDGTTWTATERRKKDILMRQFCRTGRKGVEVASGNSEAYRANYDGIDWGTD
jgi:hypothetical protein